MTPVSITVAPDTVTYGNMIKVLANLMPVGEARSKMALQIFQRCCGEGLVGPLVWNEVRRAVPKRVLDQIILPRLGGGNLDSKTTVGQVMVHHLPREWRRSTSRDDKARVSSKRGRRRSRDPKPAADGEGGERTFIVETLAQGGGDM